MSLDFNRILILMEKDWSDIKKSKYVVFSIIGLPILLVLIMPLTVVAPFTLLPETDAEEINILPMDFPGPTSNWNDLSDQQKIIVILVYFSHLCFLIIPCAIPSVIAADSIAGEKERKSFEGVLATPITDKEILIGKIGIPFLIGLIVTWISAVPYSIFTILVTYDKLGFIVVPDLNFILILLMFSPAAGLLTSICMVFVSSRVSSSRDAQQLGALLVLPFLLFIFSQLVLAFFSPLTILIGTGFLLFIDFLLFRLAVKSFSREYIITRLS